VYNWPLISLAIILPGFLLDYFPVTLPFQFWFALTDKTLPSAILNVENLEILTVVTV